MAAKKLSAAQRLLLEQASKGPLVYAALDGYGRRVAGILEDAGLVKNEGELVEITEQGRGRLNRRKKHAKPAKTNGNGDSAPTKPKPVTLDARLAALAALDAEYKTKRAAVELAAPYFGRG